MSKQAEAKVAQGYTNLQVSCGLCRHYRSNIVREAGLYDFGYPVTETDKRCSIGGFFVRKSWRCDLFLRTTLQGAK